MATIGAILEGARASQTNSTNSDLPNCGVARDFKAPPANLSAMSPAVVDLHGSQYAASFLDDGQTQQTEYAIWAANSSQVALVPITTTNANTKGVVAGTGGVPQGTLTVGPYTDGADYLTAFDSQGRSVGNILSILYRVGPSAYYLLVGTGVTPPTVNLEDEDGDPIPVTTVLNAFSTVDADAGYVGLSNAALTALGGGVSQARGDTVYQSYLVLANQTFWWSKNDAQTTRFTYDNKIQKWQPIKGGSVQDVGVIKGDLSILTLTPAPRDFGIGEYLPADATVSDKYAMLRVGSVPSATASTPVAYVAVPAPGQFSGVRVVADEDVDTFAFSGGDAVLAGVVGVSSGKLKVNPAWITVNVGLRLWYSAYTFDATSNGEVAPLLGTNTTPRFIAPIPSLTETPFIRIGSRRYLTAITVKNDADLLAAPAPSDNQVIVSLSTGRLRFNTTLPTYADPASPSFNPAYLGENIYYDGVACCAKPQPLRQPAQAVTSGGGAIPNASTVDELYLPIANPFGANGLGTSGIFYLPDDTGSTPKTGTPPVRAGGDNLGDTNIGLVRRIGPRIGAYALADDAIYWYGGAVPMTKAVGYTDDLPSFRWQVDADEVLITEQAASGTLSQVMLNGDTQDNIEGPLYYLNALLTPAFYTNKARLVSRIRNSFTVSGNQTETLYFRINGDRFVWSASLLTPTTITTYTADQMAASLLLSPRVGDNVPLGVAYPNAVYTDRGYLIMEASAYIGIGFGTTLDLSGCRVTGFLPGWQATNAQDNWCNDSGLSFGLGRSPLNLARTSPTPDYIDRARTVNQVLTKAVGAVPYQRFDYPPLRDVVGYGDDVFFRRIAVVKGQPISTDLRQYEDILYEFGFTRFGWLGQSSIEATVIQPLAELPLGNTSVVPQTMLGVTPNPSGGLTLAEGNGPFQALTLGTDYLLPSDGAQGAAILIDSIGQEVANGYRGQWTAGTTTFTDTQANFVTAGAAAGYLLRVYPSGSTPKTYTVTSVTNATTLEVTPAFDTSTLVISGNWQLFEGLPDTVYDRAVLADFVYNTFNPLPDQTITVHLLSPLGTTPTNAAAQSANRLQADVADALKNGRALNLRFNAEGTNTAALTQIGQTKMGIVANNSLTLQGVGNTRYTTQSFSVLVGNTLFTHGGANPLTPVAVFSPNPVGVEYLTATGLLKFNSSLLSNFAGSLVYQVDEFLPAASLTAGQAEYKVDGTLNLSAADLAANQLTTVFLEENLTMGVDMLVSPMAGSFYLNKPLRPYQQVKAIYWQAGPSGELAVDASGNPIAVTEFLPFYKQLEVATRVTANIYSFDPPDSNGVSRTLKNTITPTVYVGASLQNYGQETTATFDYAQRTVTLKDPVDTTTEVKVSYAVVEAFGGERSFTTTTTPIFQPPFFLTAETSSFKLAGNRTDLVAGMMMRLGAATFYIQSVSYDPDEAATPDINAPYLSYPNTTGITTVEIYPPTVTETGARSPSQQALTLITARPVTDLVGTTPAAGPAGMWLEVTNQFDPVNRGDTAITFQGPVQFTTPAPVTLTAGMILELDGQPYTIAKSQLSDDGTQQIVSVTAPFPYFFTFASGINVRVSARPIYPLGAKEFLPVGPMVGTETVEITRFPEGQAGITLVPELDWKYNVADGAVQLLDNVAGLQVGERLILRWTAQRVLSATIDNGVLQIPRYTASYRYLTTPSTDNGLLGSTVQARYSFLYPDSFYCRDLPLLAYLGDFAQGIASTTQQTTGQSQGPLLTSVTPSLFGQGQQSLLAQRQGLVNADRAARTFLTFYNDTIVAFEQVLEAMDGQIVGDRDGKFRFYISDAGFVPAPGRTDPFTGTLTTRNVYSEVWNALSGVYLPLRTSDTLVTPSGYSLTNGELDGDTPNSNQLKALIYLQESRIRNDIDDLVLIGSKGTFGGAGAFGWLDITGVYERLGDPNYFSRLFPEVSQGVFVTLPGLDANPLAGVKGEYAFANFDKLFSEGVRSTFFDQIGQMTSPVLGPLTNLTSVSMEIRTPRGWVFGYYPNGIPANSLFAGQAAIPQPCAIVTVIPISEVPINPTTGFPDATQFSVLGGGLSDLTTGTTDTMLPYWRHPNLGNFAKPMQLEGGTPDGKSQALTTPTPFDDGNLGGLYVYDILHGCVVRFANVDGNLIGTGNSDLIQTLGVGYYAPQQGDTLRVRVRPDEDDTTLYQTLVHKDNYDAYVNFTTGQVRDLTASFVPFQDPMVPLEFVQAQVSFTNSNTEPTRFPALSGEALLDNGDYSFPFIGVANTEMERFDQITNAMASVMTTRGPLPNQYYVYPNEILLADGNVKIAATATLPPATLLTAADFTPPAAIGTGSVNPFDLLLVQTVTGTPTLPASSLGFQTVAAYAQPDATTRVDVPRFPSQTKKGAEIEYRLENYMAFVTSTGKLMLAEDRTGAAPNGQVNKWITLLDFSAMAAVSGGILDSGWNMGAGVAGVGGLNTFIAANPSNEVRIRVYTLTSETQAGTPYDQGDIVEEIVITSASVQAIVAGTNVNGTTQFGWNNNHRLIRFIPTANLAGSVLGLPTLPVPNRFGTINNPAPNIWETDSLFYFSISLYGYSDSAFIDTDRLTFKEVIDLRHAQTRGTIETDGGWDVQTKLLVERVRARNSANVPQWLVYKYLNGKTGDAPASDFGCPFTFLPRVAGNPIGTFSIATGPATNDEVGSIKVMAWEGVKPTGTGALLIPNMVGNRVDTVTVFSGGAGYFGGYVELVFDPPPAGGRRATAIATVTGGVITNVTVKLKGYGYPAPPNITVRHFAGNQPVPATTDMVVSAIPSSPDNTAGTICTGTALLGFQPVLGLRPVLRESSLSSGSLGDIQSGDIVTVTNDTVDPLHEATEMAGTYLVRHTVVPAAPANPQKDLNLSATVGAGAGWANSTTPIVVSWDEANLTLTLNTLGRFGGIVITDGTENVAQTTLTTAEPHGYTVGESVRIGGALTIPSINGTWQVVAVPSDTTLQINAPIGPAGFAYGGRIMESAEPMPPHLWQGVDDYGAFPNPTTFNAAYGQLPRIYIVTKLAGFDTEVISMAYTDVGDDPNNNKLKLVNGTAQDKTGAGITDAVFFASLQSGQKVGGMVYFPIVLSNTAGVQNNIMAYQTGTVNGFRHIRIQNTDTSHIANFPIGNLTSVAPYSGYLPPAVGDVGIGVCIPRDSDRFILRRNLAVYPDVPALLDLTGVANNQGATLTGAGRPHTLAGAACLFTGDQLYTSTTAGADTLQVVAGVYLEPSFPTSANPVVGGPWVGQIFSVSNTNPAEVTFDPAYQVGPLRQGDTVAICNTAESALNATWTVLSYTAGTSSFTIAYDRTALPPLGAGGDVYGTDQSRLVDKNTTPLLLQTVGVRDSGFQQRLQYNVRRIRRFHDANNQVSANFLPLRYAYETRRGIITAASTSTSQVTTITAASYTFPFNDPDYFNAKVYTGTQLGGFTTPDVNVKAGDLFRVINPALPPSQQVLETCIIKSVSSAGVLVLDAPGLQATITPNVTQFEIWLRNAVVPHQQSCDQLLDLITEETIIDRIVTRNPLDPAYGKGGFVTVTYGPTRIASYDTNVNKMQDDYMTTVLGKGFSDFGVQVGDIVLIDPQGAVGSHGAGANNLEFGTRPFGDISIIDRGAPAYTAGKPSVLDDNRGFYRITKINPTTNVLTVDGTTAFGSGSKASEVTFPTNSANKPTYGYAVYPTVHASSNIAPLVGGAHPEGQLALRPTSLAGLKTDGTPATTPDTFLETEYSVRPFAYRVIRPTTLLSREAIDLILTMRERMLSLIEQFKTAISGNLGGDYYTFQKNLYGRDLGFPTLPSTGTGVFRNAVIDSLVGRLNTVPFTNDSDCVSVLDRRFWILDTRLDSLTTDGTGYGTRLVNPAIIPPEVPYTAYNTTPGSTVRPVLPDRIRIVLDARDRLRDQRFSWITYRANRLSGSLPAIARFDAQYAKARAQQIAAMRQRRSLTGV